MESLSAARMTASCEHGKARPPFLPLDPSAAVRASACSRQLCMLRGLYSSVAFFLQDRWCARAGAEASSSSSSTTLHTGAVKALALLPQSTGPYALTAGQDQRLLLSELPALGSAHRNGSAAAEAACPIASYRCPPLPFPWNEGTCSCAPPMLLRVSRCDEPQSTSMP